MLYLVPKIKFLNLPEQDFLDIVCLQIEVTFTFL